jgi:poly(A) polymerase
MADAPGNTNKPKSRREDAAAVVLRLRENGHVAYFAGGCVRDMLLGLEPKDWDVATDAPPKRVQELFPRAQAVGAAFGVILVRQGPSQVEVATFRAEGTYEDGRRPTEVRFTTAEEDAKRRDFTINGLFLDPAGNQVIDYVNGQEDLIARLIRAIGKSEERFDEDHLRMLRAIRFSARFGFEIEDSTSQAIARHARRLTRISPERIAEELRMMLTPPTRTAAWRMLCRFGFDEIIFRFADPTPSAHPEISGQRPEIVSKLFPGKPISFGMALAAIALEHALAKLAELGDWQNLNVRSMVKSARQALRLSNEDSDEMENTLRGVWQLMTDVDPTVATLKRFLSEPTSSSSRAIWDILPLPPAESEKRARMMADLTEMAKSEVAPPPLITGDDLTAAGLKPGKLFKTVLDDVYDAQLEGRVHSKQEALALALRVASEAK